MNLALKKASTKLNELTATEIVAAIGAGKTTCEAVVRACSTTSKRANLTCRPGSI